MKLSETIGALAKALAQCQGEISNATKNAINPHFKSKYADLGEVLDAIRPFSSKYGLAFSQCPSMKADGRFYIETVLLHESGEYIIFEPSETTLSRNDAQGVGSATTYLRRYSIAGVFGIAQEDDDAKKAIEKDPAKVEAPARPKSPAERASEYVDTNAQGEHRNLWLVLLSECKTDADKIALAKDLYEAINPADFTNAPA